MLQKVLSKIAVLFVATIIIAVSIIAVPLYFCVHLVLFFVLQIIDGHGNRNKGGS